MLQEGEPTLEELAKQLDISVQRVLSLLSTVQSTVSLDVPCRGEDPVSFGDILEDDPGYSPEQVVMSQSMQEQVQNALACLTPRERAVIELRYGLGDKKEHSLHQVERKLGISHEAVRQVELRALRKLECLGRSRGLQDFLG
jgi:RNA polymerase primary sigma factor